MKARRGVTGETVGLVIGGLGLLLTGLGFFRVDGRSLAARVWAWTQRSRREREALERRISKVEQERTEMTRLWNSNMIATQTRLAELIARVQELEQHVTPHEQTLAQAREHLEGLDVELRQIDGKLTDTVSKNFFSDFAISMDERLRALEGQVFPH